MKTGCSARTKAGKPCKARPVIGTTRCIMHSDPTTPARLGRIGAAQRLTARHPVALPEFAPPSTPEEIRRIVSCSLVEVRAGLLQAKVGNAIAVLASVLLKLIDADSFERRLSAMESLLQQRGGKPWKGAVI